MSKPYLIRWTPRAEKTYFKVVSFILEKWTAQEAGHFADQTQNLLRNLSMNKYLCPTSKIKLARKCVISTQTSLIYRVKGNSVELVAFVDNRTNHKY